jgi:hypothetical protein
MHIPKEMMSRRNFLGGASVVIGLPMLDAMTSAASPMRHFSASPAMHLGFIYAPNGMVDATTLVPNSDGVKELSALLKPLDPVKNQCVVLTNLKQQSACPIGDGNGAHTRAAAAWLTGVAPKRTLTQDVMAGISADQVAADAWAGDTPIRSLQLGMEPMKQGAESDSGYHPSYRYTVSWQTPTQPNITETSPREVFNKLFRTDDAPLTGSVLDQVRTAFNDLRSRLGAADSQRMQEHLDEIRSLEERISRYEHTPVEDAYEERARLMCDLMKLAFETDTTRVSTLMLGAEGSDLAYPTVGVRHSHHSLTHDLDKAEIREKTARINRLHLQQFAYLVEAMAKTPYGNGTLLDHTLLLYGSGIADGQLHSHDNLPLILAGGNAVGLRGGRIIENAPSTPMNNLLVAMLRNSGIPVERHGDSTAELDLRKSISA